jgi:hypothetical protein
MLYPLSYEGVPATCYLPARTQNCPGVPAAAKPYQTVRSTGVGAISSLVGAYPEHVWSERESRAKRLTESDHQ